MSVCVLQNLEKYRVLWTDFLASCREIKSVFSLKNRSRTGKTDDFSSPVMYIMVKIKIYSQL